MHLAICSCGVRHVEGTEFSSLISLPAGCLTTFIHLGVHPAIEKLPSFTGLTSLKSLTLAFLFSLVELPSFNSLHNLDHVVLVGLVSLDSLPDLAPLTKLTSFVVADRASWFCNGFLGECDLHSPHCKVHPLWGTPAATCLADARPTKLLATNGIVVLCVAAGANGVIIDPDDARFEVAPEAQVLLGKRSWYMVLQWLSGRLQDPFCVIQPLRNLPTASCLPDSVAKATTATLAVVDRFSDTVCQPLQSKIAVPAAPTPETNAVCGGVQYRQCNISGAAEAMCYSARLMAISCN
ncbi:unnamed protein product [Phytophthora lilii]|uniref:Unnamed protein product n=1 Tax=Phytophthora lilii TaxID=2077276 RepID=A0A9W6WXU6_9STRA|nr:unnamed protein product [Phytophthora lilii]